jgi:hypothetical protein
MLIYKAKTAPTMEPMSRVDHRGRFPFVVMRLDAVRYLARQQLATLVAAAAQYEASCVGSHALHKAVHAGTVAFLRLIGSFWHMLSLYRIRPDHTSNRGTLSLVSLHCYSFGRNNNI